MSNTHKAFMIAETKTLWEGMQDALIHIGAPDWLNTTEHQQISDAELLTEFMGRLCYKSFEVGLNPNVTKIREGNSEYLGNVLKQKHGSVFEHATTTFALCNVSRIFTHELVRHRAGTAYSQESQRFVRLDNFELYIPDLTEALFELCPAEPTIDNPGASPPYTTESVSQKEWVQFRQDEFIAMADRIKGNTQRELSTFLKGIGLDEEGVSFHVKKSITSALRRLIPGGVNTNIGITANHRTWRHLIAARTSPGAEVEIVEVFNDIANQLLRRYFNIYSDMIRDLGTKQITFTNEKI